MNAFLLALTLPSLALAGAIFTAPPGCVALAPAPDVTGVQCRGSASGLTGLELAFQGGGAGPLYATSVAVDYEFSSNSMLQRLIQVTGQVNGTIASDLELFLDLSPGIPDAHAGSFTIPLTFGDPLQSWRLSVFLATPLPAGIDVTMAEDQVGLRMLVRHSPPASEVPEPSASLGILAALALFAFGRAVSRL
jgi:hypothetical protein